MAQWAVIIPADRWATERLFHHDTVAVSGGAGPIGPDDEVLLVADGEVVALAQAVPADGDDLVLAYLRRAFDQPVSASELGLDDHVRIAPVDPAVFRGLAEAIGGVTAAGDKKTWLVSVALPIEAATPAEAVRQFWSHVLELGPVELPTYVWPSGNELAMQAFVLGEEANQDPEEEDED
ncbi:hypothetical protein JIG36_42975 [Actinoplanes sp. LDG1-06]|uniref:DUF4265 domain-containing protein n=1 Tax=Paractinoplanes ovalisporus TaxID=2810368 RepID=A0ABS2AR10_9ACTN|nr:hypothetical protein [Actinoplanes ovalisporus]MBM2622288.1 hypothetical protein [Actinoplanes ovalisporus]